MGWRCVLVRRQLPLYVGEDVTEQEQNCIDAHLRLCPACRNYLASLQRSHQAITDCRSMASDRDVSSVWPEVKGCLAGLPRHQAGGLTWLPVGAMLAACVAIGVVILNRPAGIQPLASPDRIRGTLATSANGRPDLATGLSFPALQTPTRQGGLPEGFMPPGTHFHLEGAVPVPTSAGDF